MISSYEETVANTFTFAHIISKPSLISHNVLRMHNGLKTFVPQITNIDSKITIQAVACMT